MSKSDGMHNAPRGKPEPVVEEAKFPFAAVALDHGHIYGQCDGMIEAGGTLRCVSDQDPGKMAAFIETCPQVKAAGSGRRRTCADALLAGAPAQKEGRLG